MHTVQPIAQRALGPRNVDRGIGEQLADPLLLQTAAATQPAIVFVLIGDNQLVGHQVNEASGAIHQLDDRRHPVSGLQQRHVLHRHLQETRMPEPVRPNQPGQQNITLRRGAGVCQRGRWSLHQGLRRIAIQIVNGRHEILGDARPPQVRHPRVVIQPPNLRLHLVKQLGDEVIANQLHMPGDHRNGPATSFSHSGPPLVLASRPAACAYPPCIATI
ncbi:Uncharacterised protein [Mycobacterium tuberculosis]|uniref:Uncharacterized protein n=1 Tax=Mycobacterium tuberculosis TaxID=1773 RepID=A0A655AAN4_MYCTX|nr:Uncharacterised protein [Mycobacterium tuberculosis]CKR54624.1 Uncharacterised protein [Mycobacterium tuberculosis]CKR85905.1 Uncharacterised protein [Mycobacterium tuberculosis]CKS73525.1 Uncharacterised protein [Mycobacterium tuberculosis]CKT10607.1 Uncharacterised protein [Mycobacterium tuberculosis]